MKKDFRLIFFPQSVWNGLKEQGQDMAQLDFEKISQDNLQYFFALNRFDPVTKVLGNTYPVELFYAPASKNYDAISKSWFQNDGAAFYQNRLYEELGGSDSVEKPSFGISVIGNGLVAVIFSKGALKALEKDNIVLELLKSVVQKGLDYTTLHELASGYSIVVENFMKLSSRVNPIRPQSPVYR